MSNAITADEPDTLDIGQPGTNAALQDRRSSKPRYRYRLLVGRHVEADPDAQPDARHGIIPDRVFQGPCTFLSVVPDLHIRFPNKFTTPEGTNLVAGVPEGSLVFDPTCETLEDFVRRAQSSLPSRSPRPTAGGVGDIPNAQAPTDPTVSTPASSAGSHSSSLPPYAQSGKNAPPDFDRMTLKEMKEYAAAEEIDVSKADTVTALRKALKESKSSQPG